MVPIPDLKGKFKKDVCVYCSWGTSPLEEDFGVITKIIDKYIEVECLQAYRGLVVTIPISKAVLAGRA